MTPSDRADTGVATHEQILEFQPEAIAVGDATVDDERAQIRTQGRGVVLVAPVSVAVCAVALPHEPVRLTAEAIGGMAYIAAISQFGGFVVWYRGMGLIGVARASQLQLAQPLQTLVWAVSRTGSVRSRPRPILLWASTSASWCR
ncbi:EamA family transporter [Micromonospora sp. DT4]|uniref:EamA family transporter n=1 Tax=Micromonospora sp. DT4 TaxID=3393438 RepID=UPI003CF7B6AE